MGAQQATVLVDQPQPEQSGDKDAGVQCRTLVREVAAHRSGVSRALAHLENTVLALSLALLALVPLSESLLRATLHVGISGSSAILQHLVLVVGMLGGAVAAREGRMLSLSTADSRLNPAGDPSEHAA